LRSVLHEVVASINSGQYDKMLPYLTENIEATSVTQEVMSGRADVSKYFQTWFGPTGYMRSMEMKLDADNLTELSPDKSGTRARKGSRALRGEDGDLFDFFTRWTAVRFAATTAVAAPCHPLRHQSPRQSGADQSAAHAHPRRHHRRDCYFVDRLDRRMVAWRKRFAAAQR